MTCTPKHRKCPSCGACVDHLCRVLVSMETRPCAELGCKVPVTRPSGTGRWPDRCPKHAEEHRYAESKRRLYASRDRARVKKWKAQERVCVEPGCTATLTRSSPRGRWPVRCAVHQR